MNSKWEAIKNARVSVITLGKLATLAAFAWAVYSAYELASLANQKANMIHQFLQQMQR